MVRVVKGRSGMVIVWRASHRSRASSAISSTKATVTKQKLPLYWVVCGSKAHAVKAWLPVAVLDCLGNQSPVFQLIVADDSSTCVCTRPWNGRNIFDIIVVVQALLGRRRSRTLHLAHLLRTPQRTSSAESIKSANRWTVMMHTSTQFNSALAQGEPRA